MPDPRTSSGIPGRLQPGVMDKTSELPSLIPLLEKQIKEQIPTVKLVKERQKGWADSLVPVGAAVVGMGSAAHEFNSTITRYVISKLPGVSKALENLGFLRLSGIAGKGAGGEAAAAAISLTTAAIGVTVGAITGLAGSIVKLGTAALAGGSAGIMDAISLAMAKIGKVFAPIVPVIMAAADTFGDVMAQILEPLEEKFPGVVRDFVIPAIITMITAVANFAKKLIEVAKWVIESLPKGMEKTGKAAQNETARDILNVAGGGAGALLFGKGQGLGDHLVKSGKSWEAKGKEMAEEGTPIKNTLDNITAGLDAMLKKMPKPDEIKNMFDRNLDKANKQLLYYLSQQAGATAKFTDIGSMWKQIQTGSFRSPYEIERLRIAQDALRKAEELVQKTDKVVTAIEKSPGVVR